MAFFLLQPNMESPSKTQTTTPQTSSLFQVYLRLRPAASQIQQPSKQKTNESWLLVEAAATGGASEEDHHSEEGPSRCFPTHITLQPPNDSRKRAIERFGFTKIFQEEATQLDVFDETGTVDTIENVLRTGRDGLVATLGVTGSGKV